MSSLKRLEAAAANGHAAGALGVYSYGRLLSLEWKGPVRGSSRESRYIHTTGLKLLIGDSDWSQIGLIDLLDVMVLHCLVSFNCLNRIGQSCNRIHPVLKVDVRR